MSAYDLSPLHQTLTAQLGGCPKTSVPPSMVCLAGKEAEERYKAYAAAKPIDSLRMWCPCGSAFELSGLNASIQATCPDCKVYPLPAFEACD